MITAVADVLRYAAVQSGCIERMEMAGNDSLQIGQMIAVIQKFQRQRIGFLLDVALFGQTTQKFLGTAER